MELALGPAATAEPWTWAWHAFPGVWLVLGLVGAWLLSEWRQAPRLPVTDERRSQRRQSALAGWLVLWLALDWPLGLLATHLLSAAAFQYLLITLVVAPLLLFGLPRLPAGPPEERVRGLWRPPSQLLTAVAFAAVMFGSAVPAVLDGLRASSVGSLVLVSVWLLAALALWWPVLRRRGRQLRYMAAVAYLFVPFILPKIPGLVYIVADDPLYRVYAEAPRVAGLAFGAGIDQRAAGAVLWSAGTLMVFASLGVLFSAWYRDERRASAPASLEIPADPELVAELFAIPGAWMALERVIGHLQASLPPETTGYELRLAVRDGGSGHRVVAELHAPLSDEASAEMSRVMQHDFDHYLARMTPAQRALIEGQLGFEVVPFRTRAT